MKKTLFIAGLLSYLAPAQAQISVTENFEVTSASQMNSLPSGWTTEDRPFQRDSSKKCNGDVGVSVNLYFAKPKAKLITPSYTSDGNPAKLSFSYKVLKSFFSGGGAAPANDFNLKIEYSTDNGTTWTTKETFGGSNHEASANCVEKQINFTAAELPAGEVKFRFFAQRTTQGDFDVVLDDIMIEQSATLGTNNHELTNVTIFPNPTTDFINITAEEKIDAISIFDINGKRVHYTETNNSNSKVNVKHLTSGTYFISVKAGEKTSTEQIVIK